MAKKNTLLEVRNLSKSYPGVQALKNVSFSINKGEIRALVGENGAGKSTLVKILGGVVKPDSGSIIIDGKEIRINNPSHANEAGIVVVHQERSLFPNLNVATNLYFSEIDTEKQLFVPDKKLNLKARNLLHDYGLGNINPAALVGKLEPGQQQLVEIARAVVKKAKIIILDEPTSSLSRRETDLLFVIVNELKKKGVSIIFVSHRLDEVFELCGNVTILRDGELIITRETKDLSHQQLVELILGRKEREMYKNISTGEEGDEILSIKNLKINPKIYDVSFSLHSGEILGIAGLLGSGRTEIARAIFGLSKPDSGEIRIKGKKVVIRSPKRAITLGMGFITEDRHKEGLILEKSIKDNITLSTLNEFSNKFGWMMLRKEVKAAEGYQKQLNIVSPSIFRFVKFLSGGNQQKVVLSKWLETKPRIFILDDPTRGIDVGAKAEFYRLISKLAESGAGIIFISSELQEIISICQRILVIRNGKIVSDYSKENIDPAKILINMTGEK